MGGKMAYEIPTVEPTEVVAGDLISWKKKDFGDYPLADSWVLSYAIAIAGKLITITCTDNGDGYHLASVPAADSASWPAGKYHWQSYITLGLERYLISSDEIIVQPNFAKQEGGYDGRSEWEIILENVIATIKGTATKDQSSYTIAGRQLSRRSMSDLIILKKEAQREVAKEKNKARIAKGLGTNSLILTRFK